MQVPRLINDYIVYDELTNSGIISSNNSIYSAYNSSGTLYIDTNNNLQSQSNNGVLYMKDNLQTYSTTGIIIYNSNSRDISSINYPANGVMTYVNETSSIESITPPANSNSILICDKSGNIVWSNSITNNTDNVLVYDKSDGIKSISNSTDMFGIITNAHYNNTSFVEGVYQLTNKFIINDAEIINESDRVVNQMYIPVGSPSNGLFPAKVNESNVIPSGDFAGMFVNGNIITSNIFTLNNYLNSINTSNTINSILAYSNSKIVRSGLPTSGDFYTLIRNNNVISYSSVKEIPATYKYVSGTHLIKNVINSSINLSNILCISSGTGSNIQQVRYDNGDNGVLTVDANNNIKINNEFYSTLSGYQTKIGQLESQINNNYNNIQFNSNTLQNISGTLSALEDRVQTNLSNISTNSNSINILSSRVQVAEININSISSSLSIAINDITGLENNMSNANTDISNLQNDMTTANNNISNLQGRMNTVEGYNGRINTLSNDLSNLSETVDNHTTSITTLQNDMSNVQKYDSKITTNSTSINVLSSDLSTLSGTVNIINTNIDNINVFKNKFNGVNDMGLIGYNGVSYIDVANINNNTPRSILMYTNNIDEINEFKWNQTTGSTAAGFSNNGNLVNLASYSWITSNVLATTTSTTGWQPLNIVGNNFYKSTFDGSGNMYAYNNSGNLIPINAANLKNQAGITVNQEGIIQNISGILKINKKINDNMVNLSCNIPFSETSSLDLNQKNGTVTICDYNEAINNLDYFVKKVWTKTDYSLSVNELHNLKLTIELPIQSFERHTNNTVKFTKCIIGVYTQLFMCKRQQDIRIISNRSEIVSSNSNTMVYDNKEILLGTIPVIFNDDTVTVNKNIKLTTIVQGYYNPSMYNQDGSNTINESIFNDLFCKFRILWIEGDDNNNTYSGYIYNNSNSSIYNDTYVTITLNNLSNIGINDNYIDQYFKINVDMNSSTKQISTESNNSNINYIQQSTCLYLSVEVDDINFIPEQVINIIPSSS